MDSDNPVPPEDDLNNDDELFLGVPDADLSETIEQEELKTSPEMGVNDSASNAPLSPIGDSTETEERVISPGDIPLEISVQTGKMSVSLAELYAMREGNTLPLGRTPEEGVDLMVGGKCVAKGELIKLGDKLGVRIIEICK